MRAGSALRRYKHGRVGRAAGHLGSKELSHTPQSRDRPKKTGWRWGGGSLQRACTGMPAQDYMLSLKTYSSCS